MILLLIFLPLNFKESFFNYFNLREKVADFSERSSQHFSSAVGAYWKHCLSFWYSEGVLGLSFWDSEGVLGFSFWDSKEVLGLSFWDTLSSLCIIVLTALVYIFTY